MTGPSAGDAITSVTSRYPSDMSNVLCLKLAGLKLDESGTLSWPKRRAIPLIVLLFLPLVGSLADPARWPPTPKRFVEYVILQCWFVVLEVVVIGVAYVGCRTFLALAPDLDRMLTERGLAAYNDWATDKLRAPSQVFALIAGGVLGVEALAFVEVTLGDRSRIHVTVWSYLAVFLAAALAGVGAYWAAHGAGLAIRLSKQGRLQLLWLVPVRTPGIERLSRCYREMFFCAVIGTSLYLAPFLYWTYNLQDSPTTEDVHGWVTGANLAFIAAAIGVWVVLGAIPQWFLSRAVIRARLRDIRRLSRRLERSRVNHGASASETLAVAGLLKQASDSPTTTINDRTIAAVIVGVAVASLPFLFQVARF